jgi:hypothetical protein
VAREPSILLTGSFFAILMLISINPAIRRRHGGKLPDPPLHTDFTIAELLQMRARRRADARRLRAGNGVRPAACAAIARVNRSRIFRHTEFAPIQRS